LNRGKGKKKTENNLKNWIIYFKYYIIHIFLQNIGLSGKFVPILKENWNAEDLNFSIHLLNLNLLQHELSGQSNINLFLTLRIIIFTICGVYNFTWIKDLSFLVSSQINKYGHKKYFCDRYIYIYIYIYMQGNQSQLIFLMLFVWVI